MSNQSKRSGLSKKQAKQSGHLGGGFEDTPHGNRVAMLKKVLRQMIRERRLTLLEIREAVAAINEMEN
jgi:hypothetical protein